MSVISEICVGERATVDAADPWTLIGVKLLGRKSRNKREYPQQVQEAAHPQFENAKIYADHGDLDGKKPLIRKRAYAERLGIVKAGTIKFDPVGECTRGNVRLNSKHPLAAMVKEDYENETPGVGFSFTADCEFAGGGNTGECVAIKRIFSIDLVDDPATTISLTEAMAVESEYEKGKDHGEMMSRLDAHDKTMADHMRMHEEHSRRIDGHDGEHRMHHERHADHEGRMSHLESSLAECNREYEQMGGAEQAKAVEQFREKQAAAEKAVAEANKLVAESKEAFKKVPRTPNAGNPMEVRSAIPVPVTNGVGLQKPNFNHRN